MKTIQAIRSKRVVTPDGVKPATVHIRNGVIAAVAGYNDLSAGKHIYDAGESVVMPGLVDTHVHINEPGRTDWEGFDTATRAAAAGGVTTLIDMPLNSIPATTTLAALETKRAAARKKCWVNVGFWGGVVPGNACELRTLSHAGVFGFKCFLVPSGVPEFENVNESDLRAALPKLAAPLQRSAAGPRGTSRTDRKGSREASEGGSEKVRHMAAFAASPRGNRSDRDDDSPRARIQSASPHCSCFFATFGPVDSPGEKGRTPLHC